MKNVLFPYFFLNTDFSLVPHATKVLIPNYVMGGTVSQICHLGSRFYIMQCRNKV